MESWTDKLREAFGRLDARQRFQLAIALVAALGLVWGFTVYVNRVRYGVLFSNLAREDAGAVVAALKDRQVPFQLTGGGALIEVPFERIDELRLELAGDGLPAGGGVGFELFDKPSFGLSDFVQNVNYRRALERELARTIQSLASVQSARVHLALPPPSVFADERREPSASVVLQFRSGRVLASDRVRAITHMVASGVEGLDASRVSVIDGEGRMLSNGDETDSQALSASQLESRQTMERNIETTLVSLLEPLVGAGKVRARVTVELNMTRVQRVEESYDPNGTVVRSEQKSKTRNQDGSAAGGVPGTDANLPGGAAAAASNAGRQESQSTVTNFEINKVVSTISEPVGMLARQSVAVVIDHATPAAAGAPDAPGGDASPRSAEEMTKIADLVRAAIGYDEERGDQVIVQNIPFDAVPTTLEGGGGGAVIWEMALKVLRYASLPLAVLLLALLVFRPAIAAVRGLKSATGAPNEIAPPTVAELQARLAGQLAGSGEGSTLRGRLVQAVTEDPRTAALVIRNWMEQRAGKGRGPA